MIKSQDNRVRPPQHDSVNHFNEIKTVFDHKPKLDELYEELVKKCNDLSPTIKPGHPFSSSNLLLRVIYVVASNFVEPWWNVFDRLISLFIIQKHIKSTSKKLLGWKISLFFSFLQAIILGVLSILLLPFAIVGLLTLIPLQLIRPRAYSYLSPQQASNRNDTDKVEFGQTNCILKVIPQTNKTRLKISFTIATANLCLMPRFAAYINNLTASIKRSTKIANYFVGNVMSRFTNQPEQPEIKVTNVFPKNSVETVVVTSSVSSKKSDMSLSPRNEAVSEMLSEPADFLCLQEVFDETAAKPLVKLLSKKYPYIIYNISWPFHHRRISILSSGLLIASKYLFLDIKFKAYKYSQGDDKLACKGLLMTKVYLGRTITNEEMVGYIANTHLQAWSNDNASKARCRQLESINKWIDEFIQTSNKRESKEKIMFDLVVGDFNFDRISHYDLNEQKSQILQNYKDPCVDESGNQFEWVIGTEFKLPQGQMIRTPKKLQKVLSSNVLRPQVISSTATTDGYTRIDGKRKIDYILYKELVGVKTEITDFRFYTGLTTLTDHLPISMDFTCETEVAKTT